MVGSGVIKLQRIHKRDKKSRAAVGLSQGPRLSVWRPSAARAPGDDKSQSFVFSVCSHRLAEPGGNSRWRQPVVGRSINR
jgi:hypothetical protein